jgi:SAM-dependent methyltransferase
MMGNEIESAATELDRPGGGNGVPGRELSLNQLAPLAPNAWLRYDVISRMLPDDVSSVLEIGCGQGAFGARLAERYPKYVGLEPDADSFGVAQQRFAHLKQGEVRPMSVEELDPAERFDMVCAFEVLEHIEDDAGALAHWTAKVRPGGWLLLSVPAHQHRHAAWDQLVGHFRRYDPEKLTALVKGVGFETVEIREYGAPLGYALEAGRNAVGRRRLKGLGDEVSMEQRTSGSGRLFQPSSAAVSALTRYGTAPFRYMQRVLPHGPALVLRAKLPAGEA